SIKTVTREVHVLSSDFQRNYGAFTPGRKKKFVSLAKETKSVAKELNIPKAELQKDGFFGFRSHFKPQMHMLSIGSWFKSLGKKIKDTAVKVGQAVVNTVVPAVANLMNKSNAVKVDGAIDVRNKNVSGKNWMSGLPDNTPMWKLSYPSTHDTMTYLPEDGQTWESWKAICHRYSLKQQLELGCRFFDIRLANRDGKVRIIHGDVTYKGTVEQEVLAPALQFVKENPSEVVFLGGVGEGSAPSYFNNNPDKKYFIGNGNTSTKTIGELRGKIVFGTPNPLESVDTAEWQGPEFEELYKQCTAGVERANKLGDGKIAWHGISATAGLQDKAHVVSMLTGKQSLTPEGYADYMNPKMRNYLTAHKEIKKVGVMKFDFVGPDSKNDGKEMNPTVVWQINFR
ncbi:MAG: hypothetical protein LBS28_05155, partial [Streptococcaceae bacterium]|nr:hypothetical protein [Streptococcaceae bacterium]